MVRSAGRSSLSSTNIPPPPPQAEEQGDAARSAGRAPQASAGASSGSTLGSSFSPFGTREAPPPPPPLGEIVVEGDGDNAERFPIGQHDNPAELSNADTVSDAHAESGGTATEGRGRIVGADGHGRPIESETTHSNLSAYLAGVKAEYKFGPLSSSATLRFGQEQQFVDAEKPEKSFLANLKIDLLKLQISELSESLKDMPGVHVQVSAGAAVPADAIGSLDKLKKETALFVKTSAEAGQDFGFSQGDADRLGYAAPTGATAAFAAGGIESWKTNGDIMGALGDAATSAGQALKGQGMAAGRAELLGLAAQVMGAEATVSHGTLVNGSVPQTGVIYTPNPHDQDGNPSDEKSKLSGIGSLDVANYSAVDVPFFKAGGLTLSAIALTLNGANLVQTKHTSLNPEGGRPPNEAQQAPQGAGDPRPPGSQALNGEPSVVIDMPSDSDAPNTPSGNTGLSQPDEGPGHLPAGSQMVNGEPSFVVDIPMDPASPSALASGSSQQTDLGEPYAYQSSATDSSDLENLGSPYAYAPSANSYATANTSDFSSLQSTDLGSPYDHGPAENLFTTASSSDLNSSTSLFGTSSESGPWSLQTQADGDQALNRLDDMQPDSRSITSAAATGQRGLPADMTLDSADQNGSLESGFKNGAEILGEVFSLADSFMRQRPGADQDLVESAHKKLTDAGYVFAGFHGTSPDGALDIINNGIKAEKSELHSDDQSAWNGQFSLADDPNTAAGYAFDGSDDAMMANGGKITEPGQLLRIYLPQAIAAQMQDVASLEGHAPPNSGEYLLRGAQSSDPDGAPGTETSIGPGFSRYAVAIPSGTPLRANGGGVEMSDGDLPGWEAPLSSGIPTQTGEPAGRGIQGDTQASGIEVPDAPILGPATGADLPPASAWLGNAANAPQYQTDQDAVTNETPPPGYPGTSSAPDLGSISTTSDRSLSADDGNLPASSNSAPSPTPTPSFDSNSSRSTSSDGSDSSARFLGGGGGGVKKSAESETRIGAGDGNLTGKYGSDDPQLAGEAQWSHGDYSATAEGAAGADAGYRNDVDADGHRQIEASANAGVGGKVSAGYEDENGNFARGEAAGNVSAGASVSSTRNAETGIRDTSAGVAANASANATASWGTENGSTSATLGAEAEAGAEGGVRTNDDGDVIGVHGKVGAEVGVDGEVSNTVTNDKGSSETGISAGVGFGASADGEFGMNQEGNFVIGGEVEGAFIGKLGLSAKMEFDIDEYEKQAEDIDNRWHNGDKWGAVTETGDMLLDSAEKIPLAGGFIAGGRDAVGGFVDSADNFAKGDFKGGFEDIGEGLLDGAEDIPGIGGAVKKLREDGFMKTAMDAGEAVTDGLEKVGDKISEGAEKVGEGVKDVAEDVGEGIKDGAEAVGEGIKDGAEAVGDGIKDGAEAVGDGIKDGFKAIGGLFS